MKSKNKTYDIRSENLNCSSKKVVYLIECKTCHALYVGGTDLTNYKCAHRNYKKNIKM